MLWRRRARAAGRVMAAEINGRPDYLDKPIDEHRLVAAVAESVSWSRRRRAILARLESLSPHEREVFDLLVRGLQYRPRP